MMHGTINIKFTFIISFHIKNIVSFVSKAIVLHTFGHAIKN